MSRGDRVYSALLRLYPARFRERYGPSMLEFHRERVREARTTGESVAALWMRTVIDAFLSAFVEYVRLARGERLADAFRQDVGYAVRGLARRPGFALITIATLALGIGITAAIFSVTYGILFRSLPYPRAGQVVFFGHEPPQWLASEAEFLDYHRELRGLSGLAAYTQGEVTLTRDDTPERLRSVRVSEDFFSVLDVAPALGRVFADEEHEAQFGVVILSAALWSRSFGSDSGIVGRTIPINGIPRTVIGIMPPGFDFPEARTELWIPLRRILPGVGDRSNHFLFMVGRIASWATLPSVRSEASVLARRFLADHPESYDPAAPLIPNIERVQDRLVGSTRPFLLTLLGATGLVLLITCANVASLLLARGEGRHREMVLRGALGASRGRLLRQSLTESLVLATISGIVGLAIAWGGTEAVRKTAPSSIPRLDQIVVDWRVATFAMGVALLTGIMVGLLPAWRASGHDASETLKTQGRTSAGSVRSASARRLLVASEIAFAVITLSGTGMLVQSLWNLERADLGFEPSGVLTGKIALPASVYDDARAANFFDELLARLRAAPNVVHAGASGWRPVVDAGGLWGLLPEDRADPEGRWPLAVPQQVTPGYFSAIGTPMLAGRDFDTSDRNDATLVVIVSKRLADMVWPGRPALGRRFKLGGDSPWVTVVGVVDDIRARGFGDTPEPTMYFPYAQTGRSAYATPRTMAVIIRTSGNPERLAPTLRTIVRELDRQVPISELRTLDDLVETSVSTRRFSTGLIAAFGTLALLLAALGTYGVVSYGVTQRTFEIGVRIALGASERSVLRQVLWEGMTMCLVGLALGLLVSLALGRLIASMLVGVGPFDVATLALTSAALIVTTVGASLLPALRAARVSPVEALRGTAA
jgi:putative ABC transport system permease protein